MKFIILSNHKQDKLPRLLFTSSHIRYKYIYTLNYKFTHLNKYKLAVVGDSVKVIRM